MPALVLLAFGRSLGSGFLSDDFLFLSWAAQDWRELLARVTVDSYPQVLRPLPALAWPLGLVAGGAFWLRLLSLSLHGLNALLVGGLVRQRAGSSGQALGAALLFAVFPLSTEAVCWVSAAPDLWATAGALGVLWLAGSPSLSPRTQALALVFYFAALLSKESILLLPLIVLTVAWNRAGARLAAALSILAMGYLSARWLLFDGLGGYLDESGESLATSFSVLGLARAAFVQAPLRALTSFKDPGELWPLLAAITALLLLMLLAAFDWRQVTARRVGLAAAGVLLALLPAAPVLGVDWDHEGSRLLYWPLAVLCVFLGSWPLRSEKLAASATALLAMWFFAATTWNVKAWVRASEEVEGALAAMARFQVEVPPKSTVLVDSSDAFLGAYVFRNGLEQAARWRGLRPDLTWRRGTAAILGAEERLRLGREIFEIEPTPGGEVVERTACSRALLTGEVAPRAAVLFAAGNAAGPELVGTWRMEIEESLGSSGGLVLRFHNSACESARSLEGSAFWLGAEEARFTVGRSRRFQLPGTPAAVTPVRLGAGWPLRSVRVDFDRPLARRCWPRIELIELPALCR